MQQQQFAFICTKFPENFNRNLFAGNKKGVRQQPNSFIFSNLYFYLLRLISIPPDAYSNRAELHPALLFCVCKGTYLRGLCKFSPLFFCFSGDISSLCCCNMLIIKYFFCLLELILFVSVCTELSLIF